MKHETNTTRPLEGCRFLTMFGEDDRWVVYVVDKKLDERCVVGHAASEEEARTLEDAWLSGLQTGLQGCH